MNGAFNVVLTDESRESIALIPAGEKYALPEFVRESGVRYHTVESLNAAIQSQWKLDVTVSRCIFEGSDSVPPVFALHKHDASWQLPAVAKWIKFRDLPGLSFLIPEHQDCVSKWISSANDESWRHVPWSSPHWRDRAHKWIRECVEKSGAILLSEPVQVRVWAISCVLRVETSAGTLYFKAVPDFFGHAPVLERYLEKHFPQHFVEIVEIETNEHWMLTKEWAGHAPDTSEEWHHVLRTLTSIQLHCKDNIDELFSFACKDRRLAALPELLRPVFDELKNAEMRKLYGINEEESNELARRLQLLPQLCQKLSNCGLPETLIHGDLWGSNVIFRDEKSGKSPLIFDWTDASITHPFIDVYCLLTSEPDLSKRPILRQAHIDVWSEHFPERTVIEALELSEQIAPFYYLHAYRNVQLNAPEQSRWELEFLFMRFVRNILLIPQLA